MSLSITDVIFLTQFAANLTILGLGLYNTFSAARFLDLKISFFLFIGYPLFLLLGLFCVLTSPLTLIYSILFKLEAGFMVLNVVFFIVALLFFLAEKAAGASRQRYKPRV